MPHEIQQISPRRYKVVNTKTGEVHSKSTTLANAKAQLRLLSSLVGGAPVPVGADGTARCCIKSKFCNSSSVHYKRPKPAGYKSTYQRKKSEVTPPFKSVAKLRRMRGGCECDGGALKGTEVNQFVKASYEDRKGKTAQIGDYQLDKSLSNATTKVYHDPVTNKTVVANRGTKSTSLRDWSNNVLYAVGLYDKTGRYKQAEDTQKKAIEKYGKESITNVGHSQGAIITRNLKDKGLTNQLINVNPASKGEKIRRGETVIKSSGDVVSALVPKGKQVKIIRAKTYNPLAEHSADILEGNQTLYGEGMPDRVPVSIGRVPDRRMVGTKPSSYTPRMVGGEIPTRFL